MQISLKPFIGITGGIGSGKSTICRIFSCLGIPVFEADKIAREICDNDIPVKEAIIAEFGPKAYLPDGSYNRTWIKGLLQKYPGDVAHLNAIIHPAVRQNAVDWHASAPEAPFCLYESALITPRTKPEHISQIITVDSPLNERIQNIQKRSRMSQPRPNRRRLSSRGKPADCRCPFHHRGLRQQHRQLARNRWPAKRVKRLNPFATERENFQGNLWRAPEEA